MQPTPLLLILTLTSTLAGTVHAHAGHDTDAQQQPMQPSETDWASRHMAGTSPPLSLPPSLPPPRPPSNPTYPVHTPLPTTTSPFPPPLTPPRPPGPGRDTEEHHLQTYDAGSFFALHDFDNSGTLTADEIRRTYGLDDESLREVGEERKARVVREVLDLFDENGDGVVSRGEWLSAWGRGKRLPDSGVRMFLLVGVWGVGGLGERAERTGMERRFW